LQNHYFQNLWAGIQSSLIGLKLSIRHFWAARRLRKPMNVSNGNYFKQKTGIVTLQYPFEAIPVPDNGRYRLHNEMDDCIVCDKCAKVCPVNCIEIEPIKATEQVGIASDGSPIRLYAAKFDIDMAKCCYCGLCTTVCPTECLTMTKAYDYSEYDIKDMIYHFANLSPEEAQAKLNLLEIFQREKAEAKSKNEATNQTTNNVIESEDIDNQAISEKSNKPVFKPKVKPLPKTDDKSNADNKEAIKSEIADNQLLINEAQINEAKIQSDSQVPDNEELKPKKFIPKTKPIVKSKVENESQVIDNQAVKQDLETNEAKTQSDSQVPDNEELKPKKFIPKTKPIVKPKVENESQVIDNQVVKQDLEANEAKTQSDSQVPDNEELKPKKFIPKMKPIVKPKKTDED
jgi:formate hydrogenlyase subunit 6/NADH:ubiquinone oxidoreductase subunit I